jgi:hypothetical protein
MPDTELTVSHPIVVTVPVEGLDFNGLVAAIRQAVAQACGELLGRLRRAVERQAQGREPDRWVNRGQASRRLRLPWGEVTVETQINRRMKKQGMSWSPHGARRLAKLRVLQADRTRWEAFWARLLSETGLPAHRDAKAEVS